ncbi:hypothetical protein HII17_18615 [Thalassotalea sp. M1531]|uniref:Uncharacterized protein n=1 Tax=Thalassotalea algicola TaxID=2716224 RepID=A0A7Y0LHX3_9GAMM|nr:hypothetical protein [Thalassotalea algicola]NMP33565.1 hypothetical protein [Thalassotalea algicola]
MKLMILLLICVLCSAAFASSTTDEALLEIEAETRANALLNEKAREAKILQSFDQQNLDLLDSELELLQRMDSNQHIESTLQGEFFDSQFDRETKDTLTPKDEFEDVIFDDGFDFLDDELNELDKEIEQGAIKSSVVNPSIPTKEQLTDQQGVGIKGKEEALINKLDNSDLTDFDIEIDNWGDEVPLVTDEDDDIDDIEL